MFTPAVPLTGYGGWRVLQRTLPAQQDAFSESSQIRRVAEDFRARIGKITTAEQLVSDRSLLSVALGAFGLDGDIDNRALIRQVLEGGTIEPQSLANRLSDPRYAALSKAFGLGGFAVANTQLSTFPDEIIARYEARAFESAIGEQDTDMRLALNVAPALEDVLQQQGTRDGQWFALMGNQPLRRVMETALGFPASFAALDIDRQLVEFQDRAEATFGTRDLSQIAGEVGEEKMIRLFLTRSSLTGPAANPGASVALTLLQSQAGPVFG